MRQLLQLSLQHDQDVVTARQRAAHIAQMLGFDTSEQTRIATAVSEIVRNAFRYATGGVVSFALDTDARPQRLIIQVRDRGPGIPHLDDVLAGRYRSATGLGMGIVGTRRLVDRFAIDASPAGTSVTLEKFLPVDRGLVTSTRAQQIAEAVEQRRPEGLVEEIQHQNQELLRTLDELQRKQQELVYLNRELEDTNRGVVALYAELDERAEHLRRADELKSRFLSNMTHEFRTPVNSIIGLTNLLLDDRSREGREPEPEILYIRKAAEQLSEIVNDLLDLAKVEAGKIVVRPSDFHVVHLFGALRGMLRPLLVSASVSLVFDDGEHVPPLYSDEGKVSQILRNLISNALKFTERGEVRVSTRLSEDGDTIAFLVSDTGIGIHEQDLGRIFEEFAQVEHRIQRTVRGTGLGLPLSRRLAELLGGTLTVQSRLGAGSTFTLEIPTHYQARQPAALAPFEWASEPGKLPLLVVEDARDAHYLYEKVLKSTAYQLYPARDAREAEQALATVTPAAVILDILLDGEEAWDLLMRLKREDRTARVPIIVVSSTGQREKAIALGADAYLVKPVDRRVLLDTLVACHSRTEPPIRVLIVDDQEVARFLIRQCLPIPFFAPIEATTGHDALRIVREERADVMLLDLVMPDADGRDVLRELEKDPSAGALPVIVVTSVALSEGEHQALSRRCAAVMSKADLSRESLGEAVREAMRRRRREGSGLAPHRDRPAESNLV